MRKYISDKLFHAKQGGFVVCLENDHGCVFSGQGVNPRKSNMKNIVYMKTAMDQKKFEVMNQ